MSSVNKRIAMIWDEFETPTEPPPPKPEPETITGGPPPEPEPESETPEDDFYPGEGIEVSGSLEIEGITLGEAYDGVGLAINADSNNFMMAAGADDMGLQGNIITLEAALTTRVFNPEMIVRLPVLDQPPESSFVTLDRLGNAIEIWRAPQGPVIGLVLGSRHNEADVVTGGVVPFVEDHSISAGDYLYLDHNTGLVTNIPPTTGTMTTIGVALGHDRMLLRIQPTLRIQ